MTYSLETAAQMIGIPYHTVRQRVLGLRKRKEPVVIGRKAGPLPPSGKLDTRPVELDDSDIETLKAMPWGNRGRPRKVRA